MPQSQLPRIATNIAALQALNSLHDINYKLGVHQLRLATGKRINQAADDPAGYTIGTKFHARSQGLAVALNNVGDAKNVLAVAEGGLQNIQDILVTMKEKITQAANDALGTEERNAIELELDELAAEIDDIVEETTWNEKQLLSAYVATFQTGAGDTDYLVFSVAGGGKSVYTALTLSVDDDNLVVDTASNASASLVKVNSAIAIVSSTLQSIGATVNRLSVKESTLSVAITNTEAAYSRIFDADMAREQLETTKLQILQQTATAMLAQANVAPQLILTLLGG